MCYLHITNFIQETKFVLPVGDMWYSEYVCAQNNVFYFTGSITLSCRKYTPKDIPRGEQMHQKIRESVEGQKTDSP